MGTRKEVFISATSADLGSYRQVAKETVLTLGAHPIEETNFPTDYRELQALLARRLDPCDAIIHLVGFYYGGRAAPAAGRQATPLLHPDRVRCRTGTCYFFTVEGFHLLLSAQSPGALACKNFGLFSPTWALSLNYKTRRINNRDSPVAKIYISATYSDLKAYRDAVYRILRMLRHDVISMEDYVATDQYPLHKCLADVASCDVYVGLIGWRYGYIPERENPENKSITELEYRAAVKANIPRLLFLVDNDAAWPDASKDAVTGEADGGGRIVALRAEMQKDLLISFFKTPDQLAGLVSVAVQQSAPRRSAESATVRKVRKEALEKLLDALTEDYKAATDQMTYTLGSVDRTRLERQAHDLERKMQNIAEQLLLIQ
jgi:hypothetical protein